MSSLNLINEKPNFSSIKGLIEIINWDTGLLWKQTHGKPSIIIDIYIDHTYNSSVTVAKQTQKVVKKKSFWSKKILVQKKFWSQKIFGPKKMFGPKKICGPQKIFGPKKIFGPQKFLVP